jgi:GGDEF domain-containing protein
MPIRYNDMLIGVTASFGVAPLDSDYTVEQSLDNADQALYTSRVDATVRSSG